MPCGRENGYQQDMIPRSMNEWYYAVGVKEDISNIDVIINSSSAVDISDNPDVKKVGRCYCYETSLYLWSRALHEWHIIFYIDLLQCHDENNDNENSDY